MSFDLNVLDEGVRGEVQAFIDAQVKERAESEVAGLKSKNEELIGKQRKANETLAEREQRLEQYRVLGDRDPQKLAEMLDQIERGQLAEALKGYGMPPEKFDEIYGQRLESDRKKWQEGADQKYGELEEKYQTAEQKAAALDERVKVMSLDEKSMSYYGNLPDSLKGDAARVIADEVRKNFTLDPETQRPIALDEYGEERKDAKGKPLTIETFVNENLRESHYFLYEQPQGGGGKGGRSGGSRGYGGISSKGDRSAVTRSTFMTAAREAGLSEPDIQQAWAQLPD